MICYLDSSIILRKILGQDDSLEEWRSIETAVSSELAEIECLRVVDRMRINGMLSEKASATQRKNVYAVLEAVALVPISRQIVQSSSRPLPAVVGTLDAIHLSTALMLRDSELPALVFCTHDKQLTRAAQALGMSCLGV